MSKKWWGLLAGMVLCCATIAWAQQAVQEEYKKLGGAPAVYRTIASGSGDSQTSVTTISPQVTNGSPSIVVAPRFSVSGANCTYQVNLYYFDSSTSTYTFMCIGGTGTITADSTKTDGTSYLPTTPVFVDSAGAVAYDVRIITVSSGNCLLRAWTVGSKSSGAQ